MFLITATFVMILLLIPACDLIDASKVENPQITDENLRANATGGATPLVTGLRRQFAIVTGIQSLIGDLVADNLDNRTSFYENALDLPRTITPISFTYGAAYEGMLYMNALANFGLSVIIPNDKSATNDQIAEVRFYKGMALLWLAENYTMFPIVEKGPVVTATVALNAAVTEFNTALPLIGAASPATQQMRGNCYLGLARAYRMLGDKTNATNAANSAVAVVANGTYAGGTTHLLGATFETASIQSTLRAALVTRASNDIQPLPRLDFLDPKLIAVTNPGPVLKAEEAYLILAEVELSNGNLANARTQMTSAVTRALARGRTNFTDPDTRSTRPNVDTLTCRSDATYAPVAGLIRRRSASVVPVPTISWTSQTAATITALGALPAGTNQGQQNFEHFRTLYLLRQEIFFGEGRRMSDLGIRLPVTQRQIDGNPNVAGTAGISVVIPAWIPPTDEMKLYTGPTAGVVTMTWDMNKQLALNRASGASPFGVFP